MPRWLLPESISDVLPSEARRIEDLRRRLLDLYRAYGYELVIPPMVEYLDSLLTGSGRDLDLSTFKLVDQLSGRTMGLRADITPQVARIDAHLLDRSGVVRLCYAGSVLHARPAGLLSTREPFHVGAEIYGHGGPEADLEVVELLLESLRAAGVGRVRIDLGHVAIVRTLLQALPPVDVDETFALLQAKDAPGLNRLVHGMAPSPARAALQALPGLFGNVSDVLERAREVLPPLPAIREALGQLERLAGAPQLAGDAELEVGISLDLADARGYRYHSGVIFAAYVDGLPNAVGRGGRYDNVGAAFGRARPATGFSVELRELAGLVPDAEATRAVRAPWSAEPGLAQAVRTLRASGEVVVQMLPGHEAAQQEFECDRELAREGTDWVVRPVRER